MTILTHHYCGHLAGVRLDDEPVPVQGYQGDTGARQEHCHALDTANGLAHPGLKQS